MIVGLIVLNAILGALWRRGLGGWWTDFGRTNKLLVGSLLTWPLWLALILGGGPWWLAVGGTAAFMILMADGHQWRNWWIVVRYPIIGVVYQIGRKAGWSNYTEIAEICVGAFFGALMGCALLTLPA